MLWRLNIGSWQKYELSCQNPWSYQKIIPAPWITTGTYPFLMRGGLIIYHIGVHTFYYETRDLFSSNRSKIYNKDKHKRVKVIIFNKSAMESNTLIFDPVRPKIIHVPVRQAEVASTYVQSVIPVCMDHKDWKQWFSSWCLRINHDYYNKMYVPRCGIFSDGEKESNINTDIDITKCYKLLYFYSLILSFNLLGSTFLIKHNTTQKCDEVNEFLTYKEKILIGVVTGSEEPME